jgi:hypothetical protein
MTSKRAFYRCLVTTAALTAFALAGAAPALSAPTETYSYKDIQRPNGHERGRIAKIADAKACGASKDLILPTDVTKFNACMQAHGWAFDSSVRNSALATDGTDHEIYNNVSKQPRGDAELKAATSSCSRQFGTPLTGTETSSEFKQCMLSHGWQYGYTERAPASTVASRDSYDLPDSPNGILAFTETTKKKRSDAELQSDTEYCNQQAGGQHDMPTAAYKACMLSRGWRFTHLVKPTVWRDPETDLPCKDIGGAAVCSNF